MQIVILFLKIISIPLILIMGESHLNERNKTIALLILAFLYNNLMGFATWIAILLMSMMPSIVLVIMIGFSLLAYLITINLYVTKKVEINMMLYVMLNVVAFLTGILLF